MSRGKPTIASETPHFFKIILEDTLLEEKLLIPKTFWRKYDETLDKTVFVKLPCGSEWEMKVAEHNGRYWFKTGWPQFAEHYALQRGDLLVFRYQGNSKFDAIIFDTSTVEIDYPSISPPFQPPRSCKKVKISTSEPQSDPVKDDSPPEFRGDGVIPTATRNFEQCHFSFSERDKILKRSRTVQGNASSKSVIKPSHVIRTRNSTGLPSKSTGNSDLIARGNGVISNNTSPAKKLKPNRKQRHFCKAEKEKILASVRYESRNPFFKVVIQPSHVFGTWCYMSLPSQFVKTHITKGGRITLRDSTDKCWAGLLTTKQCYAHSTTIIRDGWRAFVKDNDLKVGNVCIFELVQDPGPLTFKVSIVKR